MERQRWAEAEKRRKEKVKAENVRRKKIHAHEKVGRFRKVVNHCVLLMICRSEGSQMRLPKAAVRSQLAR